MKRFRTLLPYIIGISIFLITGWAYAATFIVDNLGDVDDGKPYIPGDSTNTLRKCIRLANETPGADTINFSLSGTISPTSALPEIYDDGTVIDASLKWIGAWPSGQPGITLDGSGAGSGANGLGIVNGDNCHIRGLFITNFGGNGVFIRGGAQFNTVGGTGIGYRNVISGNGGGVGIVDAGAANNKVSGNYIGSGYGSIPRLHSRGGGPPWSLEFGVGNGAIPNQIGFYLAFADGTNTDWNGVYDVKEEIWYHTAISWDGTWVKVYVNGTEVYSSDRWANKTLNQGTSLIGAAAGHDYFNGLIDEVRIWNYALTQEKIRATMLN